MIFFASKEKKISTRRGVTRNLDFIVAPAVVTALYPERLLSRTALFQTAARARRIVRTCKPLRCYYINIKYILSTAGRSDNILDEPFSYITLLRLASGKQMRTGAKLLGRAKLHGRVNDIAVLRVFKNFFPVVFSPRFSSVTRNRSADYWNFVNYPPCSVLNKQRRNLP